MLGTGGGAWPAAHAAGRAERRGSARGSRFVAAGSARRTIVSKEDGGWCRQQEGDILPLVRRAGEDEPYVRGSIERLPPVDNDAFLDEPWSEEDEAGWDEGDGDEDGW